MKYFLFVTFLFFVWVYPSVGFGALYADSVGFSGGKHPKDISPAYIESLNDIGYKLYSTYPDSTLHYANLAIELGKKINDQRGIAYGHRVLGIYHDVTGDFPSAFDAYNTSLSIYTQLGDKSGISSCLNNLGVVYYDQGNYSKALEYFFESLKIEEEINNQSGIANSLNNIGLIHDAMKDHSKSLEYMLRSMEIFEKLGDKAGVAACQGNLGAIYQAMGEYDIALDYINKSLESELEAGNTTGIANSYFSLGEFYFDMKEYHKAKDFYIRSLALEESTDNKMGMTFCLNGLAKTALEEGEVELGLGFAREGFQIASLVNSPAQINLLTQRLYEGYKALGDITNALHYLEMHKLINDSLINADKAKAIASLESEAALEKKDIIIAQEQSARKVQRVLNYIVTLALFVSVFFIYTTVRARKKEKRANDKLAEVNAKVVAQADDLKKLNATKDRLIAIIGHDMRSPINSLKSILDLFDHKIIDREGFIDLSEKLRVTLDNVHLTLNNLLLWANGQMHGIENRPKMVDMAAIMDENLALFQVQAEAKFIKIQSNIPRDAMVFADEDQLKIIVRNLLSNSLKYSFEHGEIMVSSSIANNFCTVEVRDHGMGMSEDIINSLFTFPINKSRAGTNSEKGTGVGLMLCKDFVERNGGKIWVESQDGVGSRFYFTIPVASALPDIGTN